MNAQLDKESLLMIAQFLSSDIVQKHDSLPFDQRSNTSTPTSAKSSTHTATSFINTKDDDAPIKEGYLTKRGKNFGGWQTRYFVLDGPQLRYYDAVCLPEKFTNVSLTVLILVVLNFHKHKSADRTPMLKRRQMNRGTNR